MLLALVADDLTGAADAGAPFAAAGFSTVVWLSGLVPEANVVVCSTESRHMPAEQAIAATEDATRRLMAAPGGPPRLLYKKIDSALRGSPAAEALALARAAGARRLLVAPALPAQGRATVGGRQLANGVPVDEAGFEAADCDLVALFAKQEPAGLIDLATVRAGTTQAALAASEHVVSIADAVTDQDLDDVAGAALAAGIDGFAGAAGLAAALSRKLPPPERPATSDLPRVGPVLVLAGSRHPATVGQVAFARAAGRPIVTLTGNKRTAPTSADAVEAIHGLLAAGRSAIVIAPPHRVDEPALLASFAATARAALEATPLGGIVMTGGDVAAAVCRGIEAEAIGLRGEALPAVPWGVIRGGIGDGQCIVTKAGSFGPPEAIDRLIDFLERDARAIRAGR
jgi:uncharacterized protein YgbK (DUF1537 family)